MEKIWKEIVKYYISLIHYLQSSLDARATTVSASCWDMFNESIIQLNLPVKVIYQTQKTDLPHFQTTRREVKLKKTVQVKIRYPNSVSIIISFV